MGQDPVFYHEVSQITDRYVEQCVFDVVWVGQSTKLRGGVLSQTYFEGVGVPVLSWTLEGVFGKTRWERRTVEVLQDQTPTE